MANPDIYTGEGIGECTDAYRANPDIRTEAPVVGAEFNDFLPPRDVSEDIVALGAIHDFCQSKQ